MCRKRTLFQWTPPKCFYREFLVWLPLSFGNRQVWREVLVLCFFLCFLAGIQINVRVRVATVLTLSSLRCKLKRKFIIMDSSASYPSDMSFFELIVCLDHRIISVTRHPKLGATERSSYSLIFDAFCEYTVCIVYCLVVVFFFFRMTSAHLRRVSWQPRHVC